MMLEATTSGSAPTVATLGERAIIDRIRSRVPPPPASVLVGIGDDAAIVRPERNTLDVITVDGLVEGVHFDRAFVSAVDIGHKALVVNLSDLAAMGATPRVALLSLALPPPMLASDLDDLLNGLLAAAARFRVALVGGNITRSPGPLFVDVTLVGSVKPRRMLTRSGARAGDELYLSGSIGGAAAGLESLRSRRLLEPVHAAAGECEHRYRRPEPRSRLGALLGSNRAARACVDLSDGLADAVRRIADASDLGATIQAQALPIAACARDWFERLGTDPVSAAVSGGEDYELLFAVPPKGWKRLAAIKRLIGALPITRIGALTADRRVVLQRGGHDEAWPPGFAHFG